MAKKTKKLTHEVKAVERDCGTTVTTIKENPFGRFQTLNKAVRDWIKKNKDRRILRTRATTVKGDLKNKHHRAVNIVHAPMDGEPENGTEVCAKCKKETCECPKICEKCAKDPCECPCEKCAKTPCECVPE